MTTEEVMARKALALNNLRELMGYVENGSETDVKLYQDDATRTYHVKVGKEDHWGDTLLEAIEKAYVATPCSVCGKLGSKSPEEGGCDCP